MILPLLFAVARGTLAAVSLGVDLYDGAKKLWRGKGDIRPSGSADPPGQEMPFSAIEHQRAQAQAGASHGTVTGPVTSPRPPAPDTVRSFPVRPPPSSPPPKSAA